MKELGTRERETSRPRDETRDTRLFSSPTQSSTRRSSTRPRGTDHQTRGRMSSAPSVALLLADYTALSKEAGRRHSDVRDASRSLVSDCSRELTVSVHRLPTRRRNISSHLLTNSPSRSRRAIPTLVVSPDPPPRPHAQRAATEPRKRRD